jgi:hypothetical protein
LDNSDLIAFFGTPTADPAPSRLVAGPLAADLLGDTVGAVTWKGAEVLRGLAYPVRDRNWLTHAANTIEAATQPTTDGVIYSRRFDTAGGAITGRFTCTLHQRGRLVAEVTFRAECGVKVNRAGFVVLHPIADEAGAPLTVTHPDGTATRTRLPRLIAPSQPVRNIRALDYAVPAAKVRIVFAGDIFEMEDQRNWTDASFKTYCRPLSLPFPYDIAAGTEWRQTVTLDLSDGAAPAGRLAAVLTLGPAGTARLPQPALAHEEAWGEPRVAPPQGSVLVLRSDLRQSGAAARAAAIITSAPVPVELEAVLPDDVPALADALDALSPAFDTARPDTLTVLPAAYLASFQPDGQWPTGVDPVAARKEAQARFPGLALGAGVLTNFTELNRLPQRAIDPAFVTYGTTAIVHAADDRSVMQTLEALPLVHASAEALFPGVPLRLGLSAIGMRSNPYGTACAPNPDNVRTPGAMSDPRQTALFAAAFMVGVVAATEGAPVDRVVLGALAGPFALVGPDGMARPAWHVFRALCALTGTARRPVTAPAGLTGVAGAHGDGQTDLILANTTATDRTVRLPAGTSGFVLERHSAERMTRPEVAPELVALPGTVLDLPPYAVLLARLPVGA